MKTKPSFIAVTLKRCKNPLFNQLLADKHVNESGKGEPHVMGEKFALLVGKIRKAEVAGFPLSVDGLKLRRLRHGARVVRTKSDKASLNTHSAHKTFDVCAHSAHSAETQANDMATPEAQKNSTTAGYAGKKRRTNISIDSELSGIAQKYFPSTVYGSLSGFVESTIATLFRRKARKLRAAGYKLPASLFASK